MGMLQSAVTAAPRLKTPVQLAGFLFAVAAVAAVELTHKGDPVTFGMFAVLGVFLVATSLGMTNTVLELLAKNARPRFLLLMLTLFTVAVLVLVLVAVRQVGLAPHAAAAKFDVRFAKNGVKSVVRPDRGRTYEVTMEVDSMEALGWGASGATVFLGEMFVHDARRLSGDESKKAAEVQHCGGASCIGWTFLRDLEKDPMLVPPGAKNISFTRTVTTNSNAGDVYLWVMLYQREAPSGRCESIDPLPQAAGTPLLGTFTYPGDGRRIQLTNFCYGAGNLMLVGGT